MLGAIELGGTKIICGISAEENSFIEMSQFETREPQLSLTEMVGFFQDCQSKYGKLHGLGIASFGPVDINLDSPSYGSILNTPKSGWSDFPLLNSLKEYFDVPMSITTDVNAALIAEHQLGAAMGVDDAVYVTVGTGIGAGVLVNGDFVRGFLHPEIGHMRIPNYDVEGICPFHKDCLEGLASGPAIEARAGKPGQLLPPDHEIWDAVAANLADMCNNLLMTLATQRIVLGGGVMSQSGLLGRIRHHLENKLNGYLPLPGGHRPLEQLVVQAQVEQSSGLVGALILAQQTTSN